MKAAKIDANQTNIVKVLRRYGLSVLSMAALGKGAPDIAVGWGGRNYFFEIKDPSVSNTDRNVTSDQENFRRSWAGNYAVVENTEQILTKIGVSW